MWGEFMEEYEHDDIYNNMSNWEKLKSYLECAICRDGDVSQLEEIYKFMLDLEKDV